MNINQKDLRDHLKFLADLLMDKVVPGLSEDVAEVVIFVVHKVLNGYEVSPKQLVKAYRALNSLIPMVAE